jgi:hypothetical protein
MRVAILPIPSSRSDGIQETVVMLRSIRMRPQHGPATTSGTSVATLHPLWADPTFDLALSPCSARLLTATVHPHAHSPQGVDDDHGEP